MLYITVYLMCDSRQLSCQCKNVHFFFIGFTAQTFITLCVTVPFPPNKSVRIVLFHVLSVMDLLVKFPRDS